MPTIMLTLVLIAFFAALVAANLRPVQPPAPAKARTSDRNAAAL